MYTTTRDTDAAGELPLNIHTHTYTPPRVRQTAAGELPLNIHTYTYTPPRVRQTAPGAQGPYSALCDNLEGGSEAHRLVTVLYVRNYCHTVKRPSS